MADRVEIQITTPGIKEAIKSLEDLDRLKKDLNGKKIDLQTNKSDVDKAVNSVNNLTNAESEAVKEADALGDAASRAADRFQAVVGAVEAIGTALSTVASGVGLVNSFADNIFGAFETAGGMFSFNAIDSVIDSMSSAISSYIDTDAMMSRYDILNTFTSYMQLMGVSEEEANAALQRVNKSILGLPIGLDEAAYRLRRYQMFIGDLEETTNFTIGLQKAITAGGASESMKNMAYNQIERLLTTGELTTKRQWMSLLNGLGVSINFIAEEMGYGGMGGKELASLLYSSSGAAEDFLNAITKLGEGSSEAAMKLDRALGIYKTTLESWRSNIQFAFTRGGANILDSINDMLLSTTNVSMSGYMEKVRGAINQAFTETQKWIDDNPRSFTINFNALETLWNSLQKFDVGDTAKKGFKYISDFITAVSVGIGKFEGTRLQNFVAFATTIAGPIATLAKNSGPLGVAMGVVERFEDHDWSNLFGKIAENVNNIADFISGALDLIPDELMDELLAFGVTYGPLIFTGLSLASQGVHALADALKVLFALGTTFGWGTLGIIAAGIAGIAAALYEYNQWKADFHTELGFDELDEDIKKADELHQNLQGIIDEHEDAMETAKEKADLAKELLDKIEELNEAVEKSGDSDAAKELKTYVDLVNDMFPELKLGIDETTGALDDHSRAILENKDAYLELLNAMTQYEAARGTLGKLYEERIDLTIQQRKYEEQIAELEAQFSQESADYIRRLNISAKYGGYYAPDLRLTEQEQELYKLYDAYDQTLSDIDETNRSIESVLGIVTEAYTTIEGYNREGITFLSGTEINAVSKNWDYNDIVAYCEAVNNATQANDEFADSLSGIRDVTLTEQEAIDSFNKHIDELVEKYKAAKEEISATLHSIASGYEEAAKIEPLKLDDALKGVKSQNDYLQQIDDAQEKILKRILTTASEAEAAVLTGVYERKDLDEMLGYIAGFDTETYNDLIAAMYEREARIDITSSSGAVGKMALEGDIREAVVAQLMEEGGITSESIRNFVDLYWTQLQHALTNGEAIKSFEKGLPDADSVTFNGIAETYATRYAEIVSDLIAQALERGDLIDGMVNLPEIEEHAERLAHRFEKNWLTNVMIPDGGDKGAVEGILNTADSIRRKLFDDDDDGSESIGGAIGVIDKLMTDLYGVTYKELEEATNDLASVIDTFTNEHLDSIVQAFGESSDAENTLKDDTDALGQQMDTTSGSVSNLTGEISSLGAETDATNQQVQALMNSLQQLDGMSATVTINTIENTSTTSNPYGYAGGSPMMMVPYASGGEVDGIYRGYDSVAAMLTPGEFVVRRRAAQALGRNFLNSINSLNIPAAVDALMRQVNIPMTHSVVSYDNHRSYDNHATVNQYINSQNPAFTYRRASRWVGAL